MGSGILVRVENLDDGRSFERTFERGPVTIGREGPVAAIVLGGDARVSKLHATVDVRGGRLCVRDVRSTNGTFVGDTRVEPNQWVDIAAAGDGGEIRISRWKIVARAVDVSRSPTDAAAFAGGSSASRPPPKAASTPIRSPAAPDARDPKRALDTATGRIEGANARLQAAYEHLRAELREQLGALPSEQRRHFADAVAARFPDVLDDPEAVEALQAAGATMPAPIGTVSPSMVESVAFAALQELSAWYVDRTHPVSTATDVIAFKQKMRSALDELFLGFVPLAAGLFRFEQQMALNPHELPESAARRQPKTPSEFARGLLDWRDPSDASARNVRETFADLMMHQVGMLNGVLRGVQVLLTELSPETIERAYDEQGAPAGFLDRLRANRDRGVFELYRERFSDLADEENERFRLIFGPEFAEEYKQRAREARGAPSARDNPVAAPSLHPDPKGKS